MYTELSLKLKALTLAVAINGLIMGGAAFLFDGSLNQEPAGSLVARTVQGDSTRTHASVFRP